MKITFLEARMPLVKTYSDEGIKNYPMAKAFKNHVYDIEPTENGLALLHEKYIEHASKHQCRLKGNLSSNINFDSRAGKTAATDLTQTLLFDIDGLELDAERGEHAEDYLHNCVEAFIRLLPKEFQHVSYIAHASNSFMIKPHPCFHLEFMLDAPTLPSALKTFLKSLNFTIPQVRDKLKLSGGKHTLSLPIDPTVAQNDKIIFIAAPRIMHSMHKNPFDNDDNRFLHVTKKAPAVAIRELLVGLNPGQFQEEELKMVKQLRKAAGLSAKNVKHTRFSRGGQSFQVIKEPDLLPMEFAYKNDSFCYFNINGGDSNGYYCPIGKPRFIFNFKNEPIFEFEKAAPELFAWYCVEFEKEIAKENKIKPYIFRDALTDQFFTATLDLENDTILRCDMARKDNAKDWIVEQGEVVPEPIPTWDYKFEPHNPTVINEKTKTLNKYKMPELLANPVPLHERFTNATVGKAVPLFKELCPLIHKVFDHATGNAVEEQEYFLNWLAYVIQCKTVTPKVWVFQGTQRTGKNFLYEKVLKPLFGGARFAPKKRINELESGFNGWLEESLLCLLDEFDMESAKNVDFVENLIKDYTGGSTQTIEKKFCNSVTLEIFINFIIFSNVPHCIKVAVNDQRYNLFPRQEISILDAYPSLNLRDMDDEVDEELKYFASFLMSYDADKTIACDKVIYNQAKKDMQNNTLTWPQELARAINIDGDLDFFADVFELTAEMGNTDCLQVMRVQEIVTNWAKEAPGFIRIPQNDLCEIYNLLNGKKLGPKAFGKMMARNGVITSQMRINGESKKGIEVEFTKCDIVKEIITDRETAANEEFPTKKVTPLSGEKTCH